MNILLGRAVVEPAVVMTVTAVVETVVVAIVMV